MPTCTTGSARAAGPYAEASWLDIVLPVTAEALQRGADLCLLRDIYAHLPGSDPDELDLPAAKAR